MPRPATGQVVEKQTRRGVVYALRFRAYGRREYVTLGGPADGWDRARAERELGHVMADVERGIWRPARDDVPEPPAREPTFHEFASEWFASVEGDLRPNTVLDYRWQLVEHLLPHFHAMTLRSIDVRAVDRYRDGKLADWRRYQALAAAPVPDGGQARAAHEARVRAARCIGPESINKTLTRLGQILERAVEYELLDRNPVRVGRRKVKTSKAARSYLDDAGQVADLLAAAGELDAEARLDRRHVRRQAIMATLAFTGLRIDEALSLRWRHVDLAAARLTVADAKTAAGVRYVSIQPALIDELLDLRTSSRFTRPEDPVFASRTGGKLSDDNVRSRVFGAAVARANERREEAGQPPLPDKLTPHSLRRTLISALLALGWEVPVVMAEVGHADPGVTLGVYAQVMRRDEASRGRLAGLLEGRLTGTIGHWEVAGPVERAPEPAPEEASEPMDTGSEADGRGWFRTSDLSRVKRALSR